MGDEPDRADDLWLLADCGPPSEDGGLALIAYAKLRPDDLRWRDKLQEYLRTPAEYQDYSAYLSRLTLFPDRGACAAPEALALTAHSDFRVRQQATEALEKMAFERDFVDPTEWVEVIRPRLVDENPDVRDNARAILHGAGVTLPRLTVPKDLGPTGRRRGWPERRSKRQTPGEGDPG